MLRNFGLAAFTLVAFLSALATSAPEAAAAEYNYRAMSRAEIQEIPILERSYRPGHFYGNTVRRRYAAGASRGYTPDGVPQTRVANWFERRM